MTAAQDLRNQALAWRDAQDMEQAHAAIEQAAVLEPSGADIAFIRAQIAMETWRPSVDLFAAASALDPDNLMLARNYAAALADAGKQNTAIEILDRHLGKNPAWLDGHKLRANLCISNGMLYEFDSCYSAACRAEPQNLGLRLAWFHLLSLAKQWEKAGVIIDAGEALMGARPAFALARIYIASESGASAKDPSLFDAVADIRDPGLDLCQVRFWLRYGDPARAEAIAYRNMDGPSAAAFWPYLSLAWRMMGKDEAAWLDNPNLFIRSYDLPFSEIELSALTDAVRKLHRPNAQYLEQSVRGGTQTSGQLFFHHDPAIVRARELVSSAVADYINALPPCDPAHPLLAHKQSKASSGADIMFEGSWSVRLAAQGFHSRHTHVKGWISSALYIDLPAPIEMGKPPAGHLEFGCAPPELGIELLAYTQIEPVRGRLALFPSHMWHGTVPFDDGERLTIAFDVRRPHLQSSN
jgi:Tfp pilus assembly protein PilF